MVDLFYSYIREFFLLTYIQIAQLFSFALLMSLGQILFKKTAMSLSNNIKPEDALGLTEGIIKAMSELKEAMILDIIESLGGKYQGKLKMLMASMIGVDQSNVKNSVSVDGQIMKYEPIFIFHKGYKYLVKTYY